MCICICICVYVYLYIYMYRGILYICDVKMYMYAQVWSFARLDEIRSFLDDEAAAGKWKPGLFNQLGQNA